MIRFVGTKSFAQEIEVKNLKKHVYFLADDKMKGRGTGSEENLKAAKYIAKELISRNKITHHERKMI